MGIVKVAISGWSHLLHFETNVSSYDEAWAEGHVLEHPKEYNYPTNTPLKNVKDPRNPKCKAIPRTDLGFQQERKM